MHNLITISSVDGHRVPGEVTDNESTRPRHGLYEMTNRVTMNKTAMHVPATVNCVLEIPETEYEQQRSETFNGEIRVLMCGRCSCKC